MKPASHASSKALIRTWIILVALTIASMVAGAVQPDAAMRPLGLGGVAVVLAAALFKSRQILLDFLGLRGVAADGWRALLYVWLVLIAGLVIAAYAVALSGVLAR